MGQGTHVILCSHRCRYEADISEQVVAEEGERARQSEAFAIPNGPDKTVERSDLGVFELLAVCSVHFSNPSTLTHSMGAIGKRESPGPKANERSTTSGRRRHLGIMVRSDNRKT